MVALATNWVTCVPSQDAGPGLGPRVRRSSPVGTRPRFTPHIHARSGYHLNWPDCERTGGGGGGGGGVTRGDINAQSPHHKFHAMGLHVDPCHLCCG